MPSASRLPDFIIGGAMKSATTSLHRVLARHPEVFMPEGEGRFFTRGDVVQRPDALCSGDGAVPGARDEAAALDDYRQRFAAAGPNQVVGEDATTVLPSPKAPGRIEETVPDAKLIFLLRNPVDRTYSHYWHLVRTGRAVRDFEGALRHGRNTLHLRSFYRPQLERFFERFPRDQIKVLLFERYAEAPQAVVDEVCRFLGLSASVDAASGDRHAHAGRAPRFPRLHLLLNYLASGLPRRVRADPDGTLGRRAVLSLLHRLRRRNLTEPSYPPMHPDTRRQLAAVYRRENRGLEDLVDLDFEAYWDFWE
jgi:hypothetical protein